MIGMRTILDVADNSGARRLSCILPRGGDKGLRAGLGDTVRIVECRPLSRLKRWRLAQVIRRAALVGVEDTETSQPEVGRPQ